MEEQKFETPALVELFGHTKIAGIVSETTIAGGAFIRVDVPACNEQPAFTKMYNPKSIYAISPVTQEVMEALVKSIRSKPITAYDIRMILPENTQSTDSHYNDDIDF